MTICYDDAVAVLFAAHVAHVDKVVVDDDLVIIYLLAGDDRSERFDEALAVTLTLNLEPLELLNSHIEVGRAPCHVQAAVGVVADAAR